MKTTIFNLIKMVHDGIIPNKIKIEDIIYKWDKKIKDYTAGDKGEWWTKRSFTMPFYNLDQEIEILEITLKSKDMNISFMGEVYKND